MAYDPATLVYKLFEQDDGKWRVVQDSLPKIVSHTRRRTTSAIEIDNYKQTVVVDPALAWWLSGSASADKGALTLHAPKADQTIRLRPVISGRLQTTVDADGAVSTSVSEEINDIDFKVSGGKQGRCAGDASGRLDKAAFHVGADGLKTRKRSTS